MKNLKSIYLIIPFILVLFPLQVEAQEALNELIFKDQPINFNGVTGSDEQVRRLHNGRLIYKKMTLPEFSEGTDVTLKLTLRSAGDRWDKSGSCFVVSDPGSISILDVGEQVREFPENSGIMGRFPGIRATAEFEPALELLRFITPYGVGLDKEEIDAYRKPVYIPKWEKQVTWETDVSHLLSRVEKSFYIGVWIDTWTEEGYLLDLSLQYSNRPRKTMEVKPLVNTIYYIKGQSLPEFYATTDLDQSFDFESDVRNVKLHYTTTGHGGHSEGDEFSKKKNRLWIDGQLVLDFVPWRDDCASFRRYNPTSGVWLKKDSASYIDFQERAYKIKEIEERIASSDLSRSNWCPGSKVEPVVIDLGDMKAGTHELKISIDAAAAGEDKYNHWLTSAYLTYEN